MLASGQNSWLPKLAVKIPSLSLLANFARMGRVDDNEKFYEVTCVTLVMATPTASSLFCFASHHPRQPTLPLMAASLLCFGFSRDRARLSTQNARKSMFPSTVSTVFGF